MRKGFTIIELLLVIILIAAAAGLMIPVFLRFQNKNDLDLAVSQYTSGLRRAQSLSKGSEMDSSWGVSYETGKIIIYKGTNFASRDTNYDEESDISPRISISGLNDVNFTKISGNASVVGTATLVGVNGESETVTINDKGTINY